MSRPETIKDDHGDQLNQVLIYQHVVSLHSWMRHSIKRYRRKIKERQQANGKTASSLGKHTQHQGEPDGPQGRNNYRVDDASIARIEQSMEQVSNGPSCSIQIAG
jgi:hypothetical protein